MISMYRCSDREEFSCSVRWSSVNYNLNTAEQQLDNVKASCGPTSRVRPAFEKLGHNLKKDKDVLSGTCEEGKLEMASLLIPMVHRTDKIFPS